MRLDCALRRKLYCVCSVFFLLFSFFWGAGSVFSNIIPTPLFFTPFLKSNLSPLFFFFLIL